MCDIWERTMQDHRTDPTFVTEDELARLEDMRALAGMNPTPDDYEDWDIWQRSKNLFAVVVP